MNKVYILYNWDINKIIAVSEDESLMQEMLCDLFMDEVINKWYRHLSWRSYEVNELSELASRVWSEVLEWYDEYVMIMEAEIIK